MRNKIVDNIKITPNEVTAYYNKIPKDSLFFYESELEVRQVAFIRKASRELEKFAQDELSNTNARWKLARRP
jgi:peptidyl-prolyl cis-trans isomerase SurA